jgi:hypothetical protein
LALVNHRQKGPALYAAALFLARQPRAAAIADPSADLLPFYLYDMAPTLPVIVIAPGAPASPLSRWKAEGRTIFVTQPPAQDPDGWQPMAHFCRHHLIDPRPPLDVWLFGRGRMPEGGPILDGCTGVH